MEKFLEEATLRIEAVLPFAPLSIVGPSDLKWLLDTRERTSSYGLKSSQTQWKEHGLYSIFLI